LSSFDRVCGILFNNIFARMAREFSRHAATGRHGRDGMEKVCCGKTASCAAKEALIEG
jgi:hypothetical protein